MLPLQAAVRGIFIKTLWKGNSLTASLGSVDKKTSHLALKSFEFSPSSPRAHHSSSRYQFWEPHSFVPKGPSSLNNRPFPCPLPSSPHSSFTPSPWFRSHLKYPFIGNHSWDLRLGRVGCPYHTMTERQGDEFLLSVSPEDGMASSLAYPWHLVGTWKKCC